MIDSFYAIKNGKINKVIELINIGADLSKRDLDGLTLLHVASEIGNNEIARLLIDAGADINDKDDFGNTPLHYASIYGRTDIVNMLIDAGADVNEKIKHDLYTPLHYAVKRRREKIVKLLIDAGADIDAKDNWECTPIHYVSRGAEEIAKLLIDAGADLYAHNDECQMPIALAFNDCNVELMRFIVDKMEKNIKNRKGNKNG